MPVPGFVAIWSVIFFFFFANRVSSQTTNVDFLSKGFSASDLNWVDKSGVFLASSDGRFSLAFSSPQNSVYYVCVLINGKVVWTANRNNPITRLDTLSFTDDGDVQISSQGAVVFSTNTKGTDAKTLQLQNNGNLVVRDSKNQTLWQSFDHPTDALLMGQRLVPGSRLIARKSDIDYSEGQYSLELTDSLELRFNLDGQLVTYWTMDDDPRVVPGTPNAAGFASLDLGKLSVYSNSSTLISSLVISTQTRVDNSSLRLIVLASDGNLKSSLLTSDGLATPDFSVLDDACKFPNTCGPYGVCFLGGQCRCPASLSFVNRANPRDGCAVPSINACKNPVDVEFQDLDPNLSYFGNEHATPSNAASLKDCKLLCKRNCSCTGGFFQASANACYMTTTQKLGSFNLKASGYDSFIRVPASSRRRRTLVYVIIGCSLAVIAGLIAAFLVWYRRRWSTATKEDEEDGFLDHIPGLPTRFTFKQLQVATTGFSKKLGGGGFGSVYEGVLPDNTRVAVKRLESIGQGKKEFRAEVATIGSIHHLHLVRLVGFCSEGNHRLLVYEFLAGGSLDKSLFRESSEEQTLDWETRYNIAMGTARGLTYLHEDCRERIIHCDIKPENILLDEHFVAKVSDFGLAKLVDREQSHVFTTMRGTRGYLAPEWLLNTSISEKSDVYSFGMVLLEIISGRRNFDPAETSEKWYTPAYAFKQMEAGSLQELLDGRLKNSATDANQVEAAAKIALWCIQEDVHLRPSMGRVLQMFEGIVAVPDPPLSDQFAVRLHARMVDAVSERDRYSIYSDFHSQDLLSVSYLSGPR